MACEIRGRLEGGIWMTDQDLQLLSQYLDGELDDSAASGLEQRLLEDTALQAEFQRLQALDSQFKQAFRARGTDSVPPRIAAMLGAPSSNVVRFPQRSRPRWQFAVAASVAAICGILVSQSLQFSGEDSPNLLRRDVLLSAALEVTPSMAEGWTTLADGRELRPVLSFPSTGGSWCREYLLSKAETDWRGVACRGADGQWVTQAIGSEAFLNPGDAYRPAGTNNSDKVAAFIGANAADIALSARQEAEVIANRWQ